MMGKIYPKLVILLLLISGITLFLPDLGYRAQIALADIGEAAGNREYHVNLDAATIARGYTVAAFEDKIKLSLVPGILSDATGVDVLELNEPLPMPWNLDLISPVYQFEFRNKSAYDDDKPFYIQISYDREDPDFKQVFFYDKGTGGWRPLPTRDFPDDKFVRSLIHLPFARIAVFSYPDILTAGRASWYTYKSGNYTASPDFPKDSRLRVTNRENGKFVDVVVNDYGPDRGLHPDRVVDLDKQAFLKIANLSEGMVDVAVEPLYIAPDADGKVVGVPNAGMGEEPVLDFASAIAMNEGTGEIYYAAHATATLPLASLTKLIAVKVFLDTNPTLSRVVTYSLADEEYNYRYVNKWESARLALSDGESLTIEDLVYVSLVGSTNNTIETLVRVSGLDRAEFISRMNAQVADWGASSTHFIEPTGLAPENVSSALDYAIISREALKHPIIVKASTMPEYVFTTVNLQKYHKIKNTDKIIAQNKYTITGSKTGYLDEAGYCLMTRAESGGEKLIVVTMGAKTRDGSFRDTSRLIQYSIRQSEIANGT